MEAVNHTSDDDDDAPVCEPVVNKRDRKWHFDVAWQERRPWLKFQNGRMWCTVCVKFATKRRNVWADRSTGCTAMRKEKVSLSPRAYVLVRMDAKASLTLCNACPGGAPRGG